MNCDGVRDNLSAYYDGELPEPLRAEVAAHVAACADCRAELAGFQQLSALSTHLRSPQAPSGMWERLERELGSTATSRTGSPSRLVRSSRVTLLAAAILVVVAAGITWRLIAPGHGSHAEQNEVIASFLREFADDPLRAQRTLVERYGGHPIEARNATDGLRYMPVAARGVPEGYRLEGAYVLDMPCCKCVQTIFARQDGGAIAVFEHDDDQPEWFGASPTITARCNGVPMTLVEIEPGLAATWKSGPRCITVIGAIDVQEIARLMVDFDATRGATTESVRRPAT